MNLTKGTSKSANFHVRSDEYYAIGLKMDQMAMVRLFPCMADSADFAAPACKNFSWPPKLRLKLTSHGQDLTEKIQPAAAVAGGEYLGKEAYIWEAAHVSLRPWTEYRLEAASLSDGTSLASAHPRLVLSVATPGYLEEVMLKRIAGLLIAALAAVAAAVWAARNLWIERRSLS